MTFTASKILALSCGTLFATSAFAENPDFRITHRGMVLTSKSTTTKTTPPGGSSSEDKSSTMTLETFPDSIELATFLDGWAIYAYPGNSEASLWVGWAGIPNMEVGPTIGWTAKSAKVEPDGGTSYEAEMNEMTIGAYVWYSLGLGSTALEINLNPYFTMASSKGFKDGEPDAALEKVEVSGSGFGVFADFTFPFALAEKFEYAPALAVTFDSGSVEVDNDGTKGDKTEESSFAWGIEFAKFRYTF